MAHSKSNRSQQGSNTRKQRNCVAQKAYRQRQSLYVEELERKLQETRGFEVTHQNDFDELIAGYHDQLLDAYKKLESMRITVDAVLEGITASLRMGSGSSQDHRRRKQSVEVTAATAPVVEMQEPQHLTQPTEAVQELVSASVGQLSLMNEQASESSCEELPIAADTTPAHNAYKGGTVFPNVSSHSSSSRGAAPFVIDSSFFPITDRLRHRQRISSTRPPRKTLNDKRHSTDGMAATGCRCTRSVHAAILVSDIDSGQPDTSLASLRAHCAHAESHDRSVAQK